MKNVRLSQRRSLSKILAFALSCFLLCVDVAAESVSRYYGPVDLGKDGLTTGILIEQDLPGGIYHITLKIDGRIPRDVKRPVSVVVENEAGKIAIFYLFPNTEAWTRFQLSGLGESVLLKKIGADKGEFYFFTLTESTISKTSISFAHGVYSVHLKPIDWFTANEIRRPKE